MDSAVLEDRGVIEVAGPEAGELLQRLFTNDVLGLAPGEARYAALLTPQGKILVDFLALRQGRDKEARYLLDCPRALAADLARRLMLYRLRAKVVIVDRSAESTVAAFWPERPALPDTYRDPRSEDLGFRAIVAREDIAGLGIGLGSDAYRRCRITAGVPEGGADFPYGEAFPHDANLDRLHGIDFTKGCYVGQEVVSRVQHRGTARKRVALVTFEGAAPPAGADVVVGEIVIGTMGSSVPGFGLALIRTDRAADAAALGAAISSSDTQLLIAPHDGRSDRH